MACNDLIQAVLDEVRKTTPSEFDFSTYDAVKLANLFKKQALLKELDFSVRPAEFKASRSEGILEDLRELEDVLGYRVNAPKPRTASKSKPSKSKYKATKAKGSSVYRKKRPYKGKSGSSPRPTGSYGEPIETTVVTAESLQDTFDTISAMDEVSISKEHSAQLDNVLTNLIQGGLGKIGNVVLKVYESRRKDHQGEYHYKDRIVKLFKGTVSGLTNGMSLKEVKVHELIHAITGVVLANSPELLQQLGELHTRAKKTLDARGKGYEIFLNKDANGNVIYLNDKQTEVKEAIDKWNYIFNNSDTVLDGVNQGLLEFVAYGLSNEKFSSALGNVKVAKSKLDNVTEAITPTGTGIVARLMNAIVKGLSGLLERIMGNKLDESAYDVLYALTNELVHTQNSTGVLSRIDDAEATLTDNLNSKILDPINNKVRSLIDKDIIGDGLDKLSDNLADTPINSSSKDTMTTEQKAMYRQAYIRAAMLSTNATYSQAANEARNINSFEDLNRANSFLMHDTINGIGVVGHLGRALRSSHPLLEPVIQMFNTIKAEREVIRKRRGDNAKESFESAYLNPLTEASKDVIGRAIFTTDFQALKAKYSYKELTDFVNDQTKLYESSLHIQTQIEKLVKKPEHATFIINRAKGMGALMVNNSSPLAMAARNPHVALKDFEDVYGPLDSKTHEALLEHIDTLGSMYAYLKLDSTVKDALKSIWNKEFESNPKVNGITNTLVMLNGYKQESKHANFQGSEMLMTKGHYAQVYAKNVEYVVDSVANKLEMKKNGWEPTGKQMKDPVSGIRQEFYVRRISSNDALVSGAFGVDSRYSRGTTLSEIMTRNHGWDPERTREAIAEYTALQVDLSKRQNTNKLFTKYSPEESHRHVPIRDALGNIVDYAIVMKEAEQAKYLKKSYNASSLIQDMYTSLVSKEATNKFNPKLVDMLRDLYKDNPKRKQDFVFVHGENVNSDGSINKYLDYYRMLPYETRQEIGKGIHVPKVAVDILFGGRKIAIADMQFINWAQAKFPNAPIKKYISHLQTLIQELVQQHKAYIVIKNPLITVGNITSNTNVLIVEGLNFKDIKDYSLEAFKNIKRYERDAKELDAIRVQVNSELVGDSKHNALLARKSILEKQLEINPVHRLVQAGMFQTITEDVDVSQYGMLDEFGHTIKDKAQQVVGSKIVGAGESLFNNVFITGNSPIYEVLNKSTQYSDFIARYALIKHLDKTPMSESEKLKQVSETFINYDLPDPRSITFLNDMGLLMFTKFYVGIQRVIARQLKRRSASVGLNAALQSLVPGAQFDDIMEHSVLLKDPMGMVHLNPLDHFEQYTDPALFNIISMFTKG